MDNNAASGLLSPQENSSVWEILRRAHRKNQSLATAVAKLYVTEPDSRHRKWVERVTGVVCLVKDFLRKSYFIQIIDLDYHQQVWEQELYLEFVYKATQSWFHMFESDHGVAGISFADAREGETFRNVVENKLQSRKKPGRAQNPPSPGGRQYSPSTKRQAQLHNNNVPVPRITTTPTKDKKSVKRGKSKKLTKLEISGPDTSSFVHVSGMKMAESGGMEMIDNSNLIDPRLRKYLLIAGIDPSALSATEIEKANEFAEKEDIYGKIERRKTQRARERRQTMESTPVPKHRLEHIEEAQSSPPSVPQRPPPRGGSRRPLPPPTQKPSSNRKPGVPPPPPPSNGGPPPPPPPPAGGLAPPPLPSQGKPGGKPSPRASPAGSQSNLMEAIRNAGGKGGAGLKSVGDRMSADDRNSANDGDGGGGFQSVLAGALDKINTAAGFSSSEEESEDSDAWSDDESIA